MEVDDPQIGGEPRANPGSNARAQAEQAGGASAQVVGESTADEAPWTEPLRRVILAGGKALIENYSRNLSLQNLGLFPGDTTRVNPSDSPSENTEAGGDPENVDLSGSEGVEERGIEPPGSTQNGAPDQSRATSSGSARDLARASEGDYARVEADADVFWIEVTGFDFGPGQSVKYTGRLLSSLPSKGGSQGDLVAVRSANVTDVATRRDDPPEPTIPREPTSDHGGHTDAVEPTGDSKKGPPPTRW